MSKITRRPLCRLMRYCTCFERPYFSGYMFVGDTGRFTRHTHATDTRTTRFLPIPGWTSYRLGDIYDHMGESSHHHHLTIFFFYHFGILRSSRAIQKSQSIVNCKASDLALQDFTLRRDPKRSYPQETRSAFQSLQHQVSHISRVCNP